MTYRRTRKYSAERLRAMREGKARARLARPAKGRTPELPELRLRITVERFDAGPPSHHVFELLRSSRVDQYRVLVDGIPWCIAGLSVVLEGLRKATPRLLSERAR
jgi:hypothetical protein